MGASFGFLLTLEMGTPNSGHRSRAQSGKHQHRHSPGLAWGPPKGDADQGPGCSAHQEVEALTFIRVGRSEVVHTGQGHVPQDGSNDVSCARLGPPGGCAQLVLGSAVPPAAGATTLCKHCLVAPSGSRATAEGPWMLGLLQLVNRQVGGMEENPSSRGKPAGLPAEPRGARPEVKAATGTGPSMAHQTPAGPSQKSFSAKAALSP